MMGVHLFACYLTTRRTYSVTLSIGIKGTRPRKISRKNARGLGRNFIQPVTIQRYRYQYSRWYGRTSNPFGRSADQVSRLVYKSIIFTVLLGVTLYLKYLVLRNSLIINQ